MLVTEIIYSNLLRLLLEITNNPAQERYYNDLLTEDRKNEFLNLVEQIDIECRAITESRDHQEVHSQFATTLSSIQSLGDQFPDYRGHRTKEIQLLIALILKFKESIEGLEYDLIQDFDISAFNLVEINRVSHPNFHYYDNVDLKNSIILFDFTQIQTSIEYLNAIELPRDLILNLISQIGVTENILNEAKYTLVSKKISKSPSMVWATVCLHLVKAGHFFHSPNEYTLEPVVNALRKVKVGLPYQQFADSLIILSEYNYQKDLLDKYLRLYHVMENFMYKYPLTKLERNYQHKVFSIRDFQIMNDKLDKSELLALTELVKIICVGAYDGGTTFADFIHTNFTNLQPLAIAIDKIDALLLALKIKNKETDATYAYILANPNSIHKIFAQLVYSVRNSLVHNRETELHLNHFTLIEHPILNDAVKILIETFLIPTIEEIVFYLIINKNEIVWYKNSTLKLWDKTINFD